MKTSFALAYRSCLAGMILVLVQNELPAAIVGSTAFEGPPDFSQGYYYTYNGDYAGYGNGGPNQDLAGGAVDSVGAFDPTAGTLGSGALTFAYDATRVPQPGMPYPTPTDPAVQYSYWGTFQGFGFVLQSPLTSASLSDYVLRVDARVEGLLPGVLATPMSFNVKFEVPDDTLGGDADALLDVLLEVYYDTPSVNTFAVGPTFESFSAGLGDYNRIFAGSLENLETYYPQISNININFGLNEGARDFGLDAGNRLIIDNSALEQIPEPGVLALLAVGSCIGWRRHRTPRASGSRSS